MSPTLRFQINQTIVRLRAFSDDPYLEGIWIAEALTGIPYNEISQHLEDGLLPTVVMQWDELLARREQREPLQYILAKQWFYGRVFELNGQVLIPRPETERLVDEALRYIKVLEEDRKQPWKIADIGTGSGVLAVTLALEIPLAHCVACDTSDVALKLAHRNALTHQVADRVAFYKGSLLEPFTVCPDIIVTNLPYIPHSRINSLQLEVRNWEPLQALDGGADGFDWYRELFSQLKHRHWAPQLIICEIDESQGDLAKVELAWLRPHYRIELLPDLQQLDRYLVLEKIE